MSNISNIHDVQKFDSKTSKPLDGQRLAKIGYKQTAAMTKEGVKALESICVSVPQFPELSLDQLEMMRPYVVGLLHSAQDGIIRELNDTSKGTLATISDEQIDFEACLKFMFDEMQGDRLTKEKVLDWTESSGLADVLRMRCAELMGVSENPTDEQAKKIELQVSSYKEMFGSLSSGKTYLAPLEAKKLIRALELADVGDAIDKRFTARLEEMISKPKDAADLMAL